MKNKNLPILALTAMLLFSTVLKAGVNSSYTFSTATVTYTANASPTTMTDINSASMGAEYWTYYSQATNIGFTFTYDCVDYTQFQASPYGWMTLGSGMTDNGGDNNLNITGQGPILAPLWDLIMPNASGSINYKLTGTTPNQVLTVEWKTMLWDYWDTPTSKNMISFQVKLYETSNTIEFCYSQGGTAVYNTSGGATIGISGGSSSTDFYSLNGTGSAPTANYGTGTNNLATKPATNQVYRWTYTSSPMSYTSSTTTQPNTASVEKCALDQDIIAVQVVMGGGCGSPMSLTQLQINMTGSTIAGTNTNDVDRIHVYYTGTTSTFAATDEFVAGGTVPAAGTITINGSQQLSVGTNYFWIAYDINNPSATTSNVVDAECTQITVGGTDRTPTATAPAGTRAIAACSSYPGTSALGLKHWVKTDAGITLTAGKVSAWADQSGAGIVGNLAQGTASVRPVVSSAAVNYQDYIYFDGTDRLLGANTYSATAFFHTTNNTIMMVKKYLSGASVDYNWQTAASGNYRIGMECNNDVSQRFDFVNDGTGSLATGTVNILNKDVIVGCHTNATTITTKINGNTDASKSHSGSLSGTTARALNVGANQGGAVWDVGYVAEIMTFNKELSATELRRVESYLSLKYGIPLGNNQSAGTIAYVSSDGTRIWDNHSGYHNYVTGIGRDNAAGNSGLAKTKSTTVNSVNGSKDIIAIANSNFTTPVAFTNDKAFLMVGTDAGSLAAGIDVNYTHAGTAIDVQSSRIWCTQKTGSPAGGTNSLVIEVDMALVAGKVTGSGSVPSILGYGANANADIRLIVDDNTSFGNASAGEYVYSPDAGYAASGGKIYFTVPYANIPAGTGYFTIGSVNKGTAPLPIELSGFTATCIDNSVNVNWVTATETNNDYFTIERSEDGANFNPVANVKGSGNSLQAKHYSWMDENQLEREDATSYYRLKQTDYNGAFKYVGGVLAAQNCVNAFKMELIPNPSTSSSSFLRIRAEKDKQVLVVTYDVTGAVVYSKIIVTEKSGENVYAVDPDSKLKPGVYIISASSDNVIRNKKLIIQE